MAPGSPSHGLDHRGHGERLELMVRGKPRLLGPRHRGHFCGWNRRNERHPVFKIKLASDQRQGSQCYRQHCAGKLVDAPHGLPRG
jgi:hypothetical protein